MYYSNIFEGLYKKKYGLIGLASSCNKCNTFSANAYMHRSIALMSIPLINVNTWTLNVIITVKTSICHFATNFNLRRKQTCKGDIAHKEDHAKNDDGSCRSGHGCFS